MFSSFEVNELNKETSSTSRKKEDENCPGKNEGVRILGKKDTYGVVVNHGYDNYWLWTRRLGFNPWSGKIFDPRICPKIII